MRRRNPIHTPSDMPPGWFRVTERTPPPPESPGRLNGFFEITGFLGRRGRGSWFNLRKRGVPFTRGRGRTVVGDSAEIAAWWQGVQAQRSAALHAHLVKARRHIRRWDETQHA